MTETHEIDRELVMAWVDGELPPVEAREIAAHVEGCALCRELVADLREVSNRLGAWSVPQAPASLLAPQIAAPGNGSRVAPARRAWAIFNLPRWSYAVGAAAVVVVALVVSLQVQRDMMPEASVGQFARDEISGGQPQATSLEAAPLPPLPTGSAMGRSVARLQVPADVQAPSVTQMIVRIASIDVLVEKFEDARAALERLVRAHDGSIAQLQVTGSEPSRRTLRATLRVPNARMDSALDAIRQIGKVRQESQKSDDVTDSVRDLSVRLANARIEERRLNDLIARRTGDLADVLAVEQQVMRVRGEIEQMDAEVRAMQGRVAQSTITVQIDEIYRAELTTAPVSLATRMSNALVDGTRGALDSLISLAIGLLSVGPVLLLWGALVGVPAWVVVRRVRRSSRRRLQAPRG